MLIVARGRTVRPWCWSPGPDHSRRAGYRHRPLDELTTRCTGLHDSFGVLEFFERELGKERTPRPGEIGGRMGASDFRQHRSAFV